VEYRLRGSVQNKLKVLKPNEFDVDAIFQIPLHDNPNNNSLLVIIIHRMSFKKNYDLAPPTSAAPFKEFFLFYRWFILKSIPLGLNVRFLLSRLSIQIQLFVRETESLRENCLT